MNKKKITITPFVGYGEFLLYQTISEAKEVISRNGMQYNTEKWTNEGNTEPIPWDILRIDNGISLFFANDKLFKICLEGETNGILPNGIYIGMSLEDALKADDTLEYDDWEEDFQSPQGYWIEDEIETKSVVSISIFIKEALDDDLFYRYEW